MGTSTTFRLISRTVLTKSQSNVMAMLIIKKSRNISKSKGTICLVKDKITKINITSTIKAMTIEAKAHKTICEWTSKQKPTKSKGLGPDSNNSKMT
jgi:hypothetical protein